MIRPAFFYSELKKHDVNFFTGVPDSLLKNFCAYLTDNCEKNKHIIAVNEGAAIALASGYNIATREVALVYMQNSGIGNAVNPLLSLVDAEVYKIPMLLLIGWRGEPGVHDEPQHVKQGKVTLKLLKTMDISYEILSNDENELKKQMSICFDFISKNNSIYALVVKKDTFAPYSLKNVQKEELGLMSREDAIEEIVKASNRDEIFFSTTGMASRELYEIRDKYKMDHWHDFLTVGSMGHTSHIALSVALQKPDKNITVIDGDGAVLMHMGALAQVGVKNLKNLRHIVINNESHDSVGGQSTIAQSINLCGVAIACGYKYVRRVTTIEELVNILSEKQEASAFIEIFVKKGARKDLGRPKTSPIENKIALMKNL
ncbi:MAG: phosphonopyruvate decarboxylase [Endomicrobium sp.]|jgi:phosphonopyruvate decarboxylase|uniref:phosphonopyruvate decarboxylase n=1 Tax=Candidatus Endomicrobiellum cubanum TaxID=3242325 RepID=UPI0028330BFE|nr:phosphonopyruvate decarboxylase [Endomicrobium sp.]